MRLFLNHPPSISSALFYGYLKLLKAIRGKKISRNKDLRSHLAIEPGTSCTEGHALSKYAKLLPLFLGPFLIGLNPPKIHAVPVSKIIYIHKQLSAYKKIPAREVPCIVFIKGLSIRKNKVL